MMLMLSHLSHGNVLDEHFPTIFVHKWTQYGAKARYCSVLGVTYKAMWIIWFKRAAHHLPFSPMIIPPATICGKMGPISYPPLYGRNILNPTRLYTHETHNIGEKMSTLHWLLSAAAQFLFTYYFKYIIHPHKLYSLAKCQEDMEK